MSRVIYSDEIKEMIRKENRKKICKKWYAKNREAQVEKQRVWNKANAQHKRDYSKQYYIDHRDEIREKKRKKRLELKLNKV
tara:strand:+ start:3270 stop:3512 length:243 start_codon:yes stop_codon:yes gene_type:complete